MKTKILVFLLIIFSSVGFSQEANKVKTLTITAGSPAAGWGSLNVNYNINLYHITSGSAVTLSTNWSISASGTPVAGLTYKFYYDAVATIGSNDISFFGTDLTAEQALKKLVVTASYLNSTWQVAVVPDLSEDNGSGMITGTQVDLTNSVVNADINSGAVIDFDKMEVLTANKVPVLDVSGFVVASGTGSTELGYISTLSSDAQTQINTKTTSGAIVNADIGAGAAIVHTKMAPLTVSRTPVIDGSGYITASTITATELGYLSGNTGGNIQAQIDATTTKTLSQGSIYLGDAATESAPLDISTSGEIVIGNGTTATSQAISGDATLTSAGVLTVGAGAISPSKLSSDAKTEVITFNIGTINGVVLGIKIRIPYACNLVYIDASVVHTPATDPLLINFNNNGNADMLGPFLTSGDLTIPLGTSTGTVIYTSVTGNNTFAADDYLILDTKKSTATSGKVLLSLTIERID